MLNSARAKAALGVIVALLAAAGIIVPGLDDDGGSGSSGPETTTPSLETAPPESSPVEASPAEPEPPDSTTSGLEAAEVDGIATVLAAIDSGDPLPYEEDGGTFQNREGLLPSQPLGYYREYTVETPGSPDRGARRLVIGEGGEIYYTDDHYASFVSIDPDDFAP